MITTLLWLIIVALAIYKHIKLEKEYMSEIKDLNDEITFLEDKVFELSPQGYAREELCDRKNPWHSRIHWYLKSIEKNTREFSEEEVKRYEDLIE